jgi:hypothetical protein
MWPRRAERLIDASWSFFIFFSQDDIFMALALWKRLRWCVREQRQLIKAWAATVRAGDSAFTINMGAEAQAAWLELAANA